MKLHFYGNAETIVPHDTNFTTRSPSPERAANATDPPKYDAIVVAVAGNITAQNVAGTNIVFTAAPVGFIIPFKCVRIMAATTASLVGMFGS